MSQAVLERKLRALAAADPDLIATGNPGCLMQLRSGAARAGLRAEVVHPVELLARAYFSSGVAEAQPAHLVAQAGAREAEGFGHPPAVAVAALERLADRLGLDALDALPQRAPGAAAAPATTPELAGGRSRAETGSSGAASVIARSTALRSSRTLPGKSRRESASRNSSSSVMRRACAAPSSSAKCCARKGMSTRRRRSGGT